MDLPLHEALHKRPESWGLLSSFSDDTLQKVWGSNGNERAVHEAKKDLDRRLHIHSIH